MLDTGIHFIEGIPGSGKSWAAMELLLKQIVEHRRPVYTNLPVREANLRRWLRRKTPRKSENYANLYRNLSQRHMRAFMERASRVAKAEEEWREMAAAIGIKNPSGQDFTKWYDDHHPEDKAIIEGLDANWLPVGAVLIIDEARKWFPMSGAKRDPHVEDYASMHRHHHHLVYLIAQDCMQVALSFREKSATIMRVDNASSEKLIGPLSLAKLGLDVGMARYVTYTYDGWKAARETGGTVGNVISTRIVRFKDKPHIHTLYNSHTQAGVSARSADRLAEHVAKQAGVEPPPVHRKRRKKRVKSWQKAKRHRRRVFKYGVPVALMAMTFVVARFGKRVVPESVSEAIEVATRTYELKPPPAIETVGREHVRIGATRYGIGDSVGPYVVFSIAQDDGYAVLLPRDDTRERAWLCVPGKEHESLGNADDLLVRLRDEARRDRGGPSPIADPIHIPASGASARGPSVDQGIGGLVPESGG